MLNPSPAHVRLSEPLREQTQACTVHELLFRVAERSPGDVLPQLRTIHCQHVIITVSEPGLELEKVLPFLNRELVTNMSAQIEGHNRCSLNRRTNRSSCDPATKATLTFE